eukprot:150484-Pelagomonas_calceolata.AAC.3
MLPKISGAIALAGVNSLWLALHEMDAKFPRQVTINWNLSVYNERKPLGTPPQVKTETRAQDPSTPPDVLAHPVAARPPTYSTSFAMVSATLLLHT